MVPLAIAMIPEAIAQLRSFTSYGANNDDHETNYSNAAMTVMCSASAFQKQASDTRLSLSGLRPPNTNLQKAMATRKSPLSASLAIVKEQKDAKSGSRKTIIRVISTLWHFQQAGKPKQVIPLLYFSINV